MLSASGGIVGSELGVGGPRFVLTKHEISPLVLESTSATPAGTNWGNALVMTIKAE
jgi:hypothetical protein